LQVPNGETSTTDGVLVTFLSGDAAHIVHEKSDEEIVELCVASLKNMFPEQVSLCLASFIYLLTQSPLSDVPRKDQ